MAVNICLVMIATNEEHRILDVLKSVAPYIKSTVIINSGNKDRTEEIAREFCYTNSINIYTDFHELKSGGDQRSFALATARNIYYCDYYLMLDADNILEVDTGAEPFNDLTGDCYSIRKVCGNIDYAYACLFKTGQLWRYAGVIHEYPTRDDGPFSMQELPGCRVIESVKTNATRNLARHYYDHALILERELFYNTELDDFMRTRYLFYLAQSYQDAGFPDRAMECYRQRIDRGGWEEEIYICLLRMARITGEHRYMEQAWNYRPSRLEAAYELMLHYAAEGLYNIALMIGSSTRSHYVPMQQAWEQAPFTGITTDILFLETHLYGPAGEFEKLFQEVFEKRSFKK